MALLVKFANKKDEQFVSELLEKLGYNSTSIDQNTLEDLAFGAVLRKNSKKDLLTVEEARAVYKKLNKKK